MTLTPHTLRWHRLTAATTLAALALAACGGNGSGAPGAPSVADNKLAIDPVAANTDNPNLYIPKKDDTVIPPGPGTIDPQDPKDPDNSNTTTSTTTTTTTTTTTSTTPTTPTTPTSAPAPAPEIKHLSMSADDSELTTGSKGSFTILRATATDNAGLPVPNAKITFSAEGVSLGKPFSTETDSTGHAIASISSEGNKHNRIAHAHVASGSDPTIHADSTINVSGTHFAVTNPTNLHGFVDNVINARIVDSDDVGVPDFDVAVSSSNGSSVALASPKTDASGNISITLFDTAGGTDILTLQSDSMSATIDATTVPHGPDDLQLDLSVAGSQGAKISTDVNGANTVTVNLMVKTLDGQPMKSAAVRFLVDDSGVQKTYSATTGPDGSASINVGAGSDLSNRTIIVTAKVGTSSSKIPVAVAGTTLTTTPSPLLTTVATPDWQVVLRDSKGRPIPNATVKAAFWLKPFDNAEMMIGFNPVTLATLGSVVDTNSTDVESNAAGMQTVTTDANGIAYLKFGAAPDTFAGKVVFMHAIHGAGGTGSSMEQMYFEGVAAISTTQIEATANLLTESIEYRFSPVQWPWPFVIFPATNKYGGLNAKGPTVSTIQCNSTYTRITANVNGQDIVLRGQRMENVENEFACNVDHTHWGRSQPTTFRFWYDASDNTSLPAGTYVTPVTIAVWAAIKNDPYQQLLTNRTFIVNITKK